MAVREIFTKKVNTYLAIIGGLIVIVTAMFQLDSRWCQEQAIASQAKEIEEQAMLIAGVNKRLEVKILEDQSVNLQNRMWKMEDRYGKEPQMQPEQKEEYRNIIIDKKKVDDKIKQLRQQ